MVSRIVGEITIGRIIERGIIILMNRQDQIGMDRFDISLPGNSAGNASVGCLHDSKIVEHLLKGRKCSAQIPFAQAKMGQPGCHL